MPINCKKKVEIEAFNVILSKNLLQ